jgi:Protein of unknown function (DUF3800)
MATFIDDQGGTGWKPGSHDHFRLTAVWLPTPNVEAFKNSIRALRKKLHIRSDLEFKFSKTHSRPQWRQCFYQVALQYHFRFTACCYDKNRIASGSIEAPEFHWGCATALAAYLRETYIRAEAAKRAAEKKLVRLNETVVVDNTDDGEFLKAIKKAFRGLGGKHPGSNLVGVVKFLDSEPDETLQLADMVMGAIGAHLSGDSTWYNYISTNDSNLGIVYLP